MACFHWFPDFKNEKLSVKNENSRLKILVVYAILKPWKRGVIHGEKGRSS